MHLCKRIGVSAADLLAADVIMKNFLKGFRSTQGHADTDRSGICACASHDGHSPRSIALRSSAFRVLFR